MIAAAVMVPTGFQEDVQGLFRGSMEAFAKSAWGMLRDVFSSTNYGPDWWTTVVGGTVKTTVGGQVSEIHHPGMLNVLVLVMLPVLVILVVLQVVISLFRRSTIGLIRAFAVAVFSVPLVYITAGIMFTALHLFDQISLYILEAGGQGGDETISAVMGLFGMSWDGQRNAPVLDENYQQWAMAHDQGNPGAVLVPLLVAVVVMIGAFCMLLSLVFRNLLLTVMASFIGPAIFSQASDAAKGVLRAYMSIILGLLIAKPAMAVVLKIGMVLGMTGKDWLQMAAGLLCLFVGAAMPLLTLQLMAFLGAGAAGGLMQGGHTIRNSATRMGRGAGRGLRRAVGR